MSAPLSIFSYWTYVAPASILAGPTQEQFRQPERELTLREEASFDNLTWLKVVRQLDCKDLYFVQVAASPDLEDPLTAFLTEEQLRFALPWDARLEGWKLADNRPDAKRILAALHAHHAFVQPVVRRTLPGSQSIAAQSVQEDETLTPLSPVFVSERNMKKVLGPWPEEAMSANAHHHVGLWGRRHSWLTVTFLQAALQATLHCKLLHDALSHVLEGIRHASKQVVSISEVHEDGRRVGWWVIVGVSQPLVA